MVKHLFLQKSGFLRFIGLSGLIFLFAGGAAWAQTAIFAEPLSQRLSSYDMKVVLDTEEKTVTGRMTLHWRNPSDDVIAELQFHLYLNAFKNTQSTFMKESGGVHRATASKGSR